MKPGLVLGVMMVATAVGLAQAQNLGLGTGSRAMSAEDSAAALEGHSDRPDETSAPRKTQMNRRLGLTARKTRAFDPKEFEARGRELQGQFYEIGTAANPKQYPGSSNNTAGTAMIDRKNGSRQWIFWMGIAGVTGASAGAVGYLLMNKAHPTTAPPEKSLILTDDP